MKIKFEEIEKQIDDFVKKYGPQEQIQQIEFIVGMSRGGLIPAVLLATKLNKPLVTIYINKQDEIFFDRTEWIKHKNVLFVDDVLRSGKTANLAYEYLKQNTEAQDILIYTLYTVMPLLKSEFSYLPILRINNEVEEDVQFPWD